MTRKDIQLRTKKFHVDVIRICELLPRNAVGFETAKQVIRSAGSVGANYRATARAKSEADFIYKLEIVIEEADECMYWLEIIQESEMIKSEITSSLINEANELISILVASVKTFKARKNIQP